MTTVRRRHHVLLVVTCVGALVVSSCADDRDTGAVEQSPPSSEPADEPGVDEADPVPSEAHEAPEDPGSSPDPSDLESDEAAPARPDWLGTRVLPLRSDGFGEMLDTPEPLRDRRLPPPDTQQLATGDEFTSSITAVPDDVAARSTWHSRCPVTLDELRYVTVTFWGFDDRSHVGELLVHHTVADGLVDVFRVMHDVRFPIEEMRIVSREELDAPPTGDGNNTTAFVCRSTVQSSRWSEHALGLAVDVNPFHNPYVRGDVVLPELASAYRDRDDVRPGMILPGDVTTRAFASIGWGWGGAWRSATDPMHFSLSGR